VSGDRREDDASADEGAVVMFTGNAFRYDLVVGELVARDYIYAVSMSELRLDVEGVDSSR